MEKKIEIRCKGAINAKLEDLTPLQGNLKQLTERNFRKLKASLVRYGVSYPLFIWQGEDKIFVIDGHQRDRVLRALQSEGWIIPELPCAIIEAKDKREAMQKILLVSSQYGRVTDEGLYEFLSTNDLDFGELEPLLELPALDLGEFKAGWLQEPDFSPTSADQQGRLDKKNPVRCPECGNEFVP